MTNGRASGVPAAPDCCAVAVPNGRAVARPMPASREHDLRATTTIRPLIDCPLIRICLLSAARNARATLTCTRRATFAVPAPPLAPRLPRAHLPHTATETRMTEPTRQPENINRDTRDAS